MADSQTLIDARASLAQVNSAIEDIILGKRKTMIKIGSSSFARTYMYSDKTTLDELRAYRNDLLEIISAYDISIVPVFKNHLTIPLQIIKGIQNV